MKRITNRVVGVSILAVAIGAVGAVEANEALEKAVKVYRNSQVVHRSLVDLSRRMSLARESRNLRLLAQLQEDTAATESQLRELSRQAMKLINEAIMQKPTGKAYFIRAQIHARDGQMTEAVSDLTNAIKASPENMEFLFMRARIYHAMPEAQKKSLADLSFVIQRGHQVNEARFLRAQVYAETGQPDKALADLNACENAGFAPGRTQLYKGQTLFYAGRYQQAADYLNSVGELKLSPQIKSQVKLLAEQSQKYISLAKQEQEFRDGEAAKDDLPRVLIRTSRGDIVVELFEDHAPNTVANFISLVEKKFYDGTRFHRAYPQFMIQGGDPNTAGTKIKDKTSRDGSGGPGYTIDDEFKTSKVSRSHFRGSLSMAGAGPNTGGSQFFITHVPTFWLNGRHTVFGRVLTGQDVVDRIQIGDVVRSMTVQRKRGHAYVPKVNRK